MKSFVILYSATAALDYRFIAEPDNVDIPKQVLSLFEKRVKGLMSNETPIFEHKWLYDREVFEDVPYVLWGTASQNSFFSETFVNDKKHRIIQCFIGVVIARPDERLKLPFDPKAFSPQFNDVMGKMWNSLDSKPCAIPISVLDIKSDKYIRRAYGNRLNYDNTICRIFPSSSVDIDGLFSEALASLESVTLASGIVHRSEVTTPEYEPLLNAVSVKDSADVKDITVNRLCKKCKKPSSTLKDGLCDECYASEHLRGVLRAESTTELADLPRCLVCGKETAALIDGMCVDCYKESKLVRCQKCGQKVEYVYKNGECESCRNKRKRKERILIVCLLILVCLLGVSKCLKKSTSTPKLPSKNKPDVHFMNDNAKVFHKDSLTTI